MEHSDDGARGRFECISLVMRFLSLEHLEKGAFFLEFAWSLLQADLEKGNDMMGSPWGGFLAVNEEFIEFFF